MEEAQEGASAVETYSNFEVEHYYRNNNCGVLCMWPSAVVQFHL
jgi:hypothetical protein